MGLQAPRGTRDILPAERVYWQYLETIARQILDRAAYREICTPIFEQTPLFERGIGEATDIVSKEMYTFSDRAQRSLTLRPEGTAGVVRAYIEHGLHSQGGVQRLWYLGPMFRYERPQSGRYRQFHQLGVEVLGSADPRADAEVIAVALDILQALGLKELTLMLNSVGDREDRSEYRQALVDYLTPYKAELDPDSQERLHRNPLRILDSKDPHTQAIVKEAPRLLDYLSPRSRDHFEQVQSLLQDLGIRYQINPALVRGLDYYTHTAFEFQDLRLGNEGTVCGGGRYDHLVEELGGPATPAIGWAMGLERLILLLRDRPLPPRDQPYLYMVTRGKAAERQGLILAQQLRHQGYTVEMDLSGSAFGKQVKRADRVGATVCLVIGESEAADGTVQLKWLASGEQVLVPQQELLSETWRSRFSAPS
ncbi:histidine--tRNA ligase [Thermosynechococcus sp. PP45]|uniref:histidine--tRNA ligase n=1 Tax=unclassified Thermosynechococcus TaxID=2622553 RepID=UPI00267152BB|nr:MULTISPECIES: histidine--tRNA ligase [unclassified Thermosynechococcus]MDR7922069.1 histidine--tRNA ligase [Thermosynechococcus sp. HY213]WKT79963.1 histidine--tRNA ligase [Thermosynechococcus sp. PP45]WNC21045.1 histidine--tRNA ligase [Thermosynechococcus sp. PP22]WNC23573.1 histidine--tRNA ligase [Thermosynechococcus sp. PP551]WNC26150.1 histidine--tRNA ligase [Thermosynechococcus sp. PP555]